MSADFAIDLLKISLGLLAAYLAIAGFLPTVLSKLDEIASRVDNMAERKEYKDKYGAAVAQASRVVGNLHIGYLAAGSSAVILISYAVFSSVECVSLTCSFLWLPFAAQIALLVSTVQLIVTTVYLLRPFALASKEVLSSLSTAGKQ